MNELVKTEFYELCDKIKQIKSHVGQNLFVLGGLLSEIKGKKLYEPQYDSWRSFLGDPEISMNRTHAAKLVKVYSVFAMLTGGAEAFPADIEIDKLYLIVPFLKEDPEDSEGWLERARTCSRSDLRKLVKEAQGKLPKECLSLKEKIEEFMADMFPSDRRKEFIKEVIEAWDLWKN